MRNALAASFAVHLRRRADELLGVAPTAAAARRRASAGAVRVPGGSDVRHWLTYAERHGEADHMRDRYQRLLADRELCEALRALRVLAAGRPARPPGERYVSVRV